MKRLPVAALQERQFRLFFTGQLVSLVGDAIGPFALTWAVLDLTGSATDLGFVLASRVVPMVGFLLVGGVFADRLPRRAVMLTADLVRMGTQGGIAALLLTHHAQIWELALLQVFSGTATAFFNPASTGLTPMTVSAPHLQEANALRGISQAATGLVGPTIAGLLVVGVGPGYGLAIDSASFAVSAFYLAQLRLPAHVNLPPQSFARDLRDGWREFTARTWVWVVVLCASLANFCGGVWQVLGAAYTKHHGGPLAWTVILVGISTGGLIGGVLTLRLKPVFPLRLAVAALLPWFLPPLLFGLGLPFEVIAAGCLVASGGLMIANTVWETTLQQRIPPASLSRVSAYDWFGSLLCQPVGLSVAGPLAVVIGMRATFWLVAVLSLVIFVAALGTPSIRSLRRLEEAELEQIPNQAFAG
jgi:MFS family permease